MRLSGLNLIMIVSLGPNKLREITVTCNETTSVIKLAVAGVNDYREFGKAVEMSKLSIFCRTVLVVG